MGGFLFHSIKGTATAGGRHTAMNLTNSIGMTPLYGLIKYHAADLIALTPENCYLRTTGERERSDALETWLSVCGEDARIRSQDDGKDVWLNVWRLHLNTATFLGSDIVKLLARLNAQCEIHCYVEGPNRTWLASLIEPAVEERVLIAEHGWTDVLKLLRSSRLHPVVLSFSVTSSFPNEQYYDEPHLHTQHDEDWFYKIAKRKQWDVCMAALRKRSKGWLELKPDNFGSYYFGDGKTWFDVMRALEPKEPVPPAPAGASILDA